MDEVAQRIAEKIKNYKPTNATIELVRETKLLLLAGTAGAGKDTILRELLSTGLYERIITHTTRAPRQHDGRMEEHGNDYHFIDLATMERMIDGRRFVEIKLLHRTYFSGTSTAEIQQIHDANKVGAGRVDVQGVQEFVRINSDIKTVFLLPPSYDEWMRRLAARGAMDQDEMKQRLLTAQGELEHALEVGHFHFVINADLDKAVADVRAYAEDPNFEPKDDETKVEHAWHVLGELKRNLNS